MSEKTIKLYDKNAYETYFEAKVLSCVKEAGKGFGIVLDRTLFFPEEGGQTPDKGFIWVKTEASDEDKDIPDKALKILDVQIKDDIITHFCEDPIEEGACVAGRIDFGHRYSNMQQHTGEHIFSGIVNSKYGYDNVGFHLSDSVVTMDYSGPLTMEQLSEIELLVNKAIYENVSVTAEYPDKETLAGISYRSKKELAGDVRIVTVEGYDVCACCAPHVKRTGEIGILKVISSQNYKGGTRVSILCGQRALIFLANEHDMINALANDLSTSADNIPAQFRKQQQEISELKHKLSVSGEKLLETELDRLDKDKKHICMFADADMDPNVIRRFVNKMTSGFDGFCGVFYGDDGQGYKFVIGCSSGKNCNDILKCFKEAFQVRGGGAPAMVQGSMTGASKTDITDIFERYNDEEAVLL